MNDYFQDYVSLDLETTGLDPKTCDIIEIAMVKVRNGKIVDRMETFVFTPLNISDHVSYLTGITASDIENAPDFIELIQRIEEFIGEDPIMGHNIKFDWTFLIQKGVKCEKNSLWDTYIMSNILYPELPSHSLETNSKYFGIDHKDSHRAMADVMACVELWKILMETFPSISPDQKKKIEILKEKSKWPLIDFFLQNKPEQKNELHIPQKNHKKTEEKEEILIPKKSEHISFNCRGRSPIEVISQFKNLGKTLFVAGYEHTRNNVQELCPDAIYLRAPFSYISQSKIQKLWEKDNLDNGETTLLIKTVLMPDAKTQEELVLSHPERVAWRSVQTDNNEKGNEKSAYYQVYQKAIRSDRVIASQYHIFSDLDFVQHFDQVVVLEPQLIEDNATRAFGKYLTIDQWKSLSDEEEWRKKGEKFFNQLSRFGTKLVPSSQYPEHIILTESIVESNEFISLRSGIKEIIEPFQESELMSYLKYFQAFFNTGDKTWIRWITVDPRRGVSMSVMPLSIKGLVNRHLFQKSQVVLISDTSKKFDYLPEMESYDVGNNQKIDIELPDLAEITGTKKEGDHKALISYMAQRLPNLKGNTAVVFSSKTALKRYFFDIAKIMPEEISMLGEDISGGTGKLRDRYLSAETESKVLFVTYRNLRMFSPDLLDFDTIILQSLPFDPPGLPIHQARSAECQNSFFDYAIPHTKQNLLEIVTNFSRREGERKLIVLDRRAQEKEYGREVLGVMKKN